MARPKKNYENQLPEKKSTIWRVALYARLSRDDGDKLESDSIANQRKLLERFSAGQAQMELAGFYSDDGYTGYNFERPDFQHMIEDIKSGKVNCVVVKDLSKFF